MGGLSSFPARPPIFRFELLVPMDLDIQLSRDPATIRLWAAEALAAGLYTPGRLAKPVFEGQDDIYVMAYIPGVAWAMYHGLERLNANWKGPCGSVFVRPNMRHRGIGREIGRAVYDFYYPGR